MKLLLIDGNSKKFPAYLESMSRLEGPVELLYTDTIQAGIKQIKRGGIGLVLLAKPLFSAQAEINQVDPELKVLQIEGPTDKFFLESV